MTRSATAAEHAILRAIDENGGALSPTLIEFFAREAVHSGAEEAGVDSFTHLDGLLDSLCERELLRTRRLMDEREVLVLTDAGGAAAGIDDLRVPPTDEVALWIGVLTLLGRLTADALNLAWCDSLADAAKPLFAWQTREHFEGNPTRYRNPDPPLRPPGIGEKRWRLMEREHERACRIQSIYRESVEDAARAWIANLHGEIPGLIQPPPPFVVYPDGRTRAILFRARLEPAKSWDRQMRALARIDKLLVVAKSELIQPYTDQTDPEYDAPSFEGAPRPYATWLEAIDAQRYLHLL